MAFHYNDVGTFRVNSLKCSQLQCQPNLGKLIKKLNFRFSHLWNNVIFQLILGVLLEIVHNWKRIAIIYVASVIGGSLFLTILTPNTYAVGASGALYGLLFSHLSTIIINWNEMDRKCCRLFWLLFYITFDIGFSFYLELAVKKDSNVNTNEQTAHFSCFNIFFLLSLSLVIRPVMLHISVVPLLDFWCPS